MQQVSVSVRLYSPWPSLEWLVFLFYFSFYTVTHLFGWIASIDLGHFISLIATSHIYCLAFSAILITLKVDLCPCASTDFFGSLIICLNFVRGVDR